MEADMSILHSGARRATLRVTSGAPDTPLRFDAMLTIGRRRLRSRRIIAQQTPFEIELPDADLSAVVRAERTTDLLVVEYVLEENGECCMYGKSLLPLAILERRARGILVGGLPAPSASPSSIEGI